MLIYRVEHKETGKGPFQRDDNILARMFETRLDTHPAPRQDGILNFMEGIDHLGCVSLEQLKFWFQDYIACLKDMRMVVRVFSADDEFVQVGKTQAAFTRNVNNIVEEMPLDCLK